MPERILVTGGAGFIGSHIVDAFINAGYHVAIIDNLHTGKLENLNPLASFYPVDIRNAVEVEKVFAHERPHIVAHEAALADVRGSMADPAGYAQVNVVGSLNVLEAARRYSVRKFLFASTGGAIYGQLAHLPATEASPTYPLDAYGASKLAFEHYLYLYRQNYGLDYCALRYPNVYGPRQDPKGEAGVIAIFMGKLLNGQQPTINGSGQQSRDFVFVEDIARANLIAARCGSGIYNLGSGRGIDVNTIYRTLVSLLGCDLPAVYGPAKLGEIDHIYLDAARACNELGWQPTVPFRTGLAITLEHFQAKEWRREGSWIAKPTERTDDAERRRTAILSASPL